MSNAPAFDPTETGGLGKRDLWWKCEPTSQIERAGVVTLHLRESAPQLYPDFKYSIKSDRVQLFTDCDIMKIRRRSDPTALVGAAAEIHLYLNHTGSIHIYRYPNL